MRSSSGKYYIGLDHVRFVAVFLVFTWHFINASGCGYHAPPIFPLSFLSEGHTGVAIFMTLSGYLFAKLLEGKDINYFYFMLNRLFRITPLLIIVIILVGYQKYMSENADIIIYAKEIIYGLIAPSLPCGGWAITVEFHFYLILPFLLFFSKKWKYSLIFIIFTAVFIRGLLYQELGEIQKFSYFTILGRIDQFLFGMIAYQFRNYISEKNFFVISVMTLFATFYWYFDLKGGFLNNPSYPSSSTIWIYMPTAEGLAYALTIVWYDNSFEHSTGNFSQFIARIGTYSYSIYLLHSFTLHKLTDTINNHIIDLSNIYLAILFSTICFFLLMVPIGYISYKFVESPFLKFRIKYLFTEVPKYPRSIFYVTK